jgi:hypothetical protein
MNGGIPKKSEAGSIAHAKIQARVPKSTAVSEGLMTPRICEVCSQSDEFQ